VSSRLSRIAVACLVALAAAGGVVAWRLRSLPPGPTAGGAVSAAAIGGPFTLVNQAGKTVTEKDFRGNFLLVYFGYTYCPDVCPTELQAMAAAIDELGPLGDKVQPLFITVDPARDTPAQLADYVALFHPRLIGLTGSSEQIAAVAKAYKVYFARADAGAGSSGAAEATSAYLMDHSAFVYLMGPSGQFITLFPGGTSPAAMAAAIRERLQA
jgi:protein SCO1/2